MALSISTFCSLSKGPFGFTTLFLRHLAPATSHVVKDLENTAWKSFTGTAMSHAYASRDMDGNGDWLRRWPLVLLLTFGLLISLLHCAACGPPFALPGTASTTMSSNTGSVPDVPEQQLPAHSSHCLSHASAQCVVALLAPADLPTQKNAVRNEPFPAPLNGALPFKPPRI
jgi:hypothetical protein